MTQQWWHWTTAAVITTWYSVSRRASLRRLPLITRQSAVAGPHYPVPSLTYRTSCSRVSRTRSASATTCSAEPSARGRSPRSRKVCTSSPENRCVRLCEFLAEDIIGAPNFNFASSVLQNFAFWTQIFRQHDNFWRFFDIPNRDREQLPLALRPRRHCSPTLNLLIIELFIKCVELFIKKTNRRALLSVTCHMGSHSVTCHATRQGARAPP